MGVTGRGLLAATCSKLIVGPALAGAAAAGAAPGLTSRNFAGMAAQQCEQHIWVSRQKMLRDGLSAAAETTGSSVGHNQ